jgi:hypothetical protein
MGMIPNYRALSEAQESYERERIVGLLIEDGWRPIVDEFRNWCFRYQLLLCCLRHPRLIDTDQDPRLSELDFLRQPKRYRRREGLP